MQVRSSASMRLNMGAWRIAVADCWSRPVSAGRPKPLLVLVAEAGRRRSEIRARDDDSIAVVAFGPTCGVVGSNRGGQHRTPLVGMSDVHRRIWGKERPRHIGQWPNGMA
jgi:hypothetical protein